MQESSGAGSAPAHWEADVVLVDGGVAHIRPIRPEDAGALVEFHAGLSPETVFWRFFTFHPELADDEVRLFTRVDHSDRVALVAELGERLVAVGRYDRMAGTREAEVAFVVADEHQGRGLGTVLLEHLAAAARERGIVRFVADTLAENRRMLDVFKAAGFDEQVSLEGGVVRVELAIEPTDTSRAAVQAREHRAESQSVARLLNPRSVAVVGAGRNPAGVGHQVLRNLLDGGFRGPVYPVNPAAEYVASVRAYPSVLDIPHPVDLVVVAVPAAAVPDTVRQCAGKGVASVVVLSAGFGEITGGADTEAELRDLVRRNGMRLVGPNCIGVVNTALGLNATFSPYAPSPGHIAMQSQSGAVGIAILQGSAERGLGVSSFVSVGNKADVSGNDLLQYWEDDDRTDMVLLYLESFGNPRKFSRIARRVSLRKPIVAVKSGRSEAGIRAASSHTAALASPDTAVDALFRQVGVVRVDTLDEMFDMALLLGAQPLPPGRRMAIVTNSGGPGILAADACAGAGLVVADLTPATRSALADVVDRNAALANPIDLVASATPEVYRAALELVLADDQVDGVLVICTPTFAAPADQVATVAAGVAAGATKPVVGCFVAAPQIPSYVTGPDVGPPGDGSDRTRHLPVFRSPEPAVRALSRAAAYAEWCERPPGAPADLTGFSAADVERVVRDHLDRWPDGGWLPDAGVADLLRAAGVPFARTATAVGAQQARERAEAIGFPVVLKASGPDVVHKSDIGGVALGLATGDAVAGAYDDMSTRVGDRMTGAVVQEMAGPGIETILGVVQDPLFGPLVMFGLGGVATELLRDRAFRTLPLTDVDAAELVRSLRSSPLLFGYRGSAPVAVAELEELVQRVARLVDEVPEVAELDLNPVIVSADGVLAVDCRIRVVPVSAGPPEDLRRMSG